MYKDLFHSTVFTKKTIPGISFIYKEFRGFLALKVLKMRYYLSPFCKAFIAKKHVIWYNNITGFDPMMRQN